LVRGAELAAGVIGWTAIPYAASPAGENRWRPPQPRAAWNDEFDATRGGLACPQSSDSVDSSFLVMPDQSEDCLTLSVWAPGDAVGLPTMVWFHGGALMTGSAHQPFYDGTKLAANGVVVVGVNYRLGALGFLAHPDASDEQPDGRYGNYGIMDQQAALRWTRDNIAAFGGDPANVTLFGQSAGGASVCANLASAESEGLFHKVIIQSGGPCAADRSLAEMNTAASEFVDERGCGGAAVPLDCLRGLPVDQLLVSGDWAATVVDGVVLERTALARARSGDLAGMPMLIGSNLDEFTLFTLGEQTDLSLALMTIQWAGGDVAGPLQDLYPVVDFGSNLIRTQTMLNDIYYSCPAQRLADAVAESGGRAFQYFYTYVPASDPFSLGAFHGSEIFDLFHNPEGVAVLAPEFDEADEKLSDEIQKAWVSFAETGEPDAPTQWLPTAVDSPAIMQVDREWSMVSEIRDGRCDALGDLMAPA